VQILSRLLQRAQRYETEVLQHSVPVLDVIGLVELDHLFPEPLRLGAVRGELEAAAEYPAFARHLLCGVAECRQQHLVKALDRVKSWEAVVARLAGSAHENAYAGRAQRIGRTQRRNRLRSAGGGDARVHAPGERNTSEGRPRRREERAVERDLRQ